MIALCIHGGAGDRTPSSDDAAICRALESALDAGWAVLESGGMALDAVQVAIGVLEDEPLFNAGRGAALTRAGTVELDAALMDGATQRAGAVIGVRSIRYPIAAARAVLEHAPHVVMAGEGAERFALAHGCEAVEPAFFVTERAQRALERFLAEQARVELGTVGAVALDIRGNLAAGNSTGGVTGKLPGRVGDTPIIGAGTYADRRVAVACTGYGEYFIRVGAALRLALLVELAGCPLEEAARQVLAKVSALGGRGGIIALDRDGTIAMPFTTASMARAWRRSDGTNGVELYAPASASTRA
ncbi:Isoaspartyl peptidase [bacterium HR20]|nr:Isoaspartyl peptidase [bacterium HR20]